MTSSKTIRDKLIEILDAAGTLAAVTGWFKGEPLIGRRTAYPFAWIEWIGGPVAAPVGAKAEIRDNFYVAVVDKDTDAEKAEDKIMDWAEAVEAVLDDDPSIESLVATSFVVNREKQKLFDSNMASIVAVRLTLFTRRRE